MRTNMKSKFISSVITKDYSTANKLLTSLVEAALKAKVKKAFTATKLF